MPNHTTILCVTCDNPIYVTKGGARKGDKVECSECQTINYFRLDTESGEIVVTDNRFDLGMEREW